MRDRPELAVITLANDPVAPWLEAMARSLRRFNPDLPVYLIPFDERLRATRRICRRYNLELVESEELVRYDEVGALVVGSHHPMCRTFRKLAAFGLGARVFLFLDTDVVVLDSLSELLGTFAARAESLGYFETDHDQVYRPGLFRDRMLGPGRSVGFNSGSFLSRAGVVTADDAMSAALELGDEKGELLGTYEQPFVNYCFDRTGAAKVRMGDLMPKLGVTWAGDPDLQQALARSSWRAALRDGERSPFIHWAGIEMKYRMPCGSAFLAFADFGTRLRLMRRWLAGGIGRRASQLLPMALWRR